MLCLYQESRKVRYWEPKINDNRRGGVCINSECVIWCKLAHRYVGTIHLHICQLLNPFLKHHPPFSVQRDYKESSL